MFAPETVRMQLEGLLVAAESIKEQHESIPEENRPGFCIESRYPYKFSRWEQCVEILKQTNSDHPLRKEVDLEEAEAALDYVGSFVKPHEYMKR